MQQPAPAHTVVAVIFEGMNALDLVGPFEAFSTVRKQDGAPAYRLACYSLDGEPVKTESGLRLCADGALADCGSADLLILPGGEGVRAPETLARLGAWLAEHEGGFRRIASICTGAYLLAESGLADGARLTTHWAHAADLGRRYPAVQVEADALFVRSGRIHSSGGVAAGIDLALDLIATDFGTAAAMTVARELVVFLRRTGAQAQFSEPLRMQAHAPRDLAEVCLWAAGNLAKPLTLETLAERARLSPRQFSRKFSQAFGIAPAGYVRRLRLDAARVALVEGRAGLGQIAHATGFGTPDGLRRAFERRFGLGPAEYRQRFAAVAP